MSACCQARAADSHHSTKRLAAIATETVHQMSVNRLQALGQYKKLLRAAEKFSNYNFRDYALRVVREDFRAGSKVSDTNEALELYQKGRVQLDMLHRQSTISQLFPQGKHAMES